MSDRARFLFATLCGLFLAGIVHLTAVLAMPWLSERDAFSRLRSTLTADKSEIVAAPAAADTWLPHPDPAVAVSACAYNLDEGPVRISALVALSVLGLLLAGRLISGPSTVRARPPATTLAYRAPSRKHPDQAGGGPPRRGRRLPGRHTTLPGS